MLERELRKSCEGRCGKVFDPTRRVEDESPDAASYGWISFASSRTNVSTRVVKAPPRLQSWFCGRLGAVREELPCRCVDAAGRST